MKSINELLKRLPPTLGTKFSIGNYKYYTGVMGADYIIPIYHDSTGMLVSRWTLESWIDSLNTKRVKLL